MDIASLIVLAVVLFVREYVHQREWDEERKQVALERRELLQRIQAPREIAYKEFQETLPPGAPSEPLMTDEDFWAAMKDLGPKAAE